MLCQQKEEKLCMLLSILTQLPGKLEMIADEIDNENLKNAFSSIALESNQYAKELSEQLRSLAITPMDAGTDHLEEAIIESGLANSPKEKGREVLSICESCENFFSGLYNDLLNEYFSNAALKHMMNYQLLGIKSAFMRIRFLNSLRFNN